MIIELLYNSKPAVVVLITYAYLDTSFSSVRYAAFLIKSASYSGNIIIAK